LGNVSVAAAAIVPSDAPTPLVAQAPPQPTPASMVVSQNPAAGQKVITGATINLEVR